MRKQNQIIILTVFLILGVALSTYAFTIRYRQNYEMSLYWKENNITFTGYQISYDPPDRIGAMGILGVFMTFISLILLAYTIKSLFANYDKTGEKKDGQ